MEAQWHFYQDHSAGIMYLIRTKSPEGEEVERMLAEKPRDYDKLLEYFRENKHRERSLGSAG